MQAGLLVLWFAGASSFASGASPKAIAPRIDVDDSVHELYVCRIALVSFRTQDDGFVSDHCGNIFRTHDGGRGWSRDHQAELEIFGTPLPPAGAAEQDAQEPGSARPVPGSLTFMYWFSPTEAITGGYVKNRFFRTVDAGRSWIAVETPSKQWVDAIFVRDDAVWTCGSSGEVIHSLDRGKTWVLGASPFNGLERCIHLDFDVAHHGRATGTFGSRWTSSNDGETWVHDSDSPEPPPLTRVEGTPTTLVTTPNGGSFAVSIPQRRALHLDPLGLVSTRGAGRVEVQEKLLSFTEPNHPSRLQPLLSVARGPTKRLQFGEQVGDFAYGFTDHRFVVAEDGTTWYARSELPARPATRVTFLNERTVILEAAGQVYRSRSRGHSWEVSTQPELDLADVAKVRGLATRHGIADANPLACVATSRSARLRITYSSMGCFGGTRNNVELRVSDGQALVTGDTELRQKASIANIPIEPQEVRQVVRDLDLAVTRLEEPSACTSTTGFGVTLSWSCEPSFVTQDQKLSFSTHDCSAEMVNSVGASTSTGDPHKKGYARALGVFRLAEGLIRAHAAH